MVVYVGEDPSNQWKSLQNITTAINNAIGVAQRSKERKVRDIQRQQELAIQMGLKDPKKGQIMFEKIYESNPELATKTLGEKKAAMAIFGADAAKVDESLAAYNKWNQNLLKEREQQARAEQWLGGMPQVEEQDVMGPMGFPVRMEVPNPSFQQEAQVYEQAFSPEAMNRRALKGMSPSEEYALRRHFTREGLNFDDEMGRILTSELPAEAKLVMATGGDVKQYVNEKTGQVKTPEEIRNDEIDEMARIQAMQFRTTERKATEAARKEAATLSHQRGSERIRLSDKLARERAATKAAAEGGDSLRKELDTSLKNAGAEDFAEDVLVELNELHDAYVSGGMDPAKAQAAVVKAGTALGRDLAQARRDAVLSGSDDPKLDAKVEVFMRYGLIDKDPRPKPLDEALGLE